MATAQRTDYEEPDDSLLCTACIKYMIAPIFVCDNCDNSYCEDCKYTQPCKICHTPIGQTRNEELEEVTHKSLYRCR